MQKSQQKVFLGQALSACADFLTEYLPLANAHAVDFIIHDAWNTVLPSRIQCELLALSEEQLFQLPSNCICHEPYSPHKPSKAPEECKQNTELEKRFGDVQLHTDEVKMCEGKSEWASDTHSAESESNGEVLKKETKKNQDSKGAVWNHDSLRVFLEAVKEHCLDRLLSLNESMDNLSSWLDSRDGCGVKRVPFVHAFMNEKKMHEVEMMADLCARIFDRSSADLVIDIGSGKGYLSTHLSLQCHLPVIGIDSQPHNTSGAVQRAVKLERQWNTLVKHEQKKAEKKVQQQEFHLGITAECSMSSDMSCDTAQGQSSYVCNDACSLISNKDSHQKKAKHQIHQSKGSKEDSESKSNQNSNFCSKNQNSRSESTRLPNKNETDTAHLPQRKEELKRAETQTERSSKASSKHIAVTMFVDPDTCLSELVDESINTLCPEKQAQDVRLLLTGLHTCGPLGASMLRLFVKDEAVRVVCGVGCCYQLMQERFTGDSGLWQNPWKYQQESGRLMEFVPDQMEGDFPLSSVLLDRKMAIGRTALNIASLALPRMAQSAEELQGKTYYPRALLQAFIHSKLGHIPQDLKKLRKLAKQASGPVDYVRRAIQKLNIPGCQATEEEIDQFHAQHRHMEQKMAAFFQLRAVLAPVVETVVLLDRMLYLMEQDCVENAFLVRLFDPVASPRCHAIIAFKEEDSLKPSHLF
ncbi:putative methyltransferase-like protein 25 [Babylonia areolata]|uniref:putative methyltransferase-like protein 25 n=1 Tax=Babylonia areolata TaxID=304850 RepID=UPI003FCF5171